MSPDYAAEARRWLEGEPHCLNPAVHGSPCGCFNEDSLAKLLERLCGEAQDQKCEEIHPGFSEFRALQKNHRETVAQLSEARAEVTKLRARCRPGGQAMMRFFYPALIAVIFLACTSISGSPWWLSGVVAVFLLILQERRLERRLWNGGHCPICDGAWEHFDDDSQGGHGWKCSRAGHAHDVIWLNFSFDREAAHRRS